MKEEDKKKIGIEQETVLTSVLKLLDSEEQWERAIDLDDTARKRWRMKQVDRKTVTVRKHLEFDEKGMLIR